MEALRSSTIFLSGRHQHKSHSPTSGGKGVLAALKKKLSFKRPMEQPSQYFSLVGSAVENAGSDGVFADSLPIPVPVDARPCHVVHSDGESEDDLTSPPIPGIHDGDRNDGNYVVSDFRDVSVNNFFIDRPATGSQPQRRPLTSAETIRPASASYPNYSSTTLAAGRPPAPTSSFLNPYDIAKSRPTSSAAASRPASPTGPRAKSGRRGPRSRRLIKSGMTNQ